MYAKLPDLDEVLSYQTQQELNVLDRRLGQIYNLAFAFIFLYIVVFNFGIKKKYLVTNFKEGTVIVRQGQGYLTS